MLRLWGLWLAATLGLGGYGAMLVIDADSGTLRAQSTSATIAAYLVAFAGFLVLLVWNERRPVPRWFLWGLPVLFRVLLWATEPTLSDDVYRYLWDGHLVSQGVNPYSYAISAPELDRYEIAARLLANNPDLSSPYLPAAQFLFGLLALALPSSPLTMQVVMTLFDLATAVLLYRLLPVVGLPARRVALYLWNPLVVVELAHGAHIDGFMVLLAVASLYAALRHPDRPAGGRASSQGKSQSQSQGESQSHWKFQSRWLISPVVLALGVLTRPIPLLLAPVLWWRWSWRQRLLFGAVVVGLVVPFGFGPAGWGLSEQPNGAGVFGSARVYSQEFRFNALPSAWLERQLGDSATNLSAATAVLMALLGLVVWLLARNQAGPQPLQGRRSVRLMAVLVMGYSVITPVLHPWYLVLLAALLPFLAPGPGERVWRWFDLAPWMYLMAALSLSYLTYEDPQAFGERDWIRRVEWFPTLALMLAVIARRLWPLGGRPATTIGGPGHDGSEPGGAGQEGASVGAGLGPVDQVADLTGGHQ